MIINNNVDEIPDRYYANHNIRIVRLDRNLKRIGKEAFAGCDKLGWIMVPDGVREIDDRAFYGCSSVESLSIPATVERIGEDAFFFGSGNALKDLWVNISNKHFCCPDGVLYSKDMKKLLLYPRRRRGNKYVIPDGVEEVCAKAFIYADKLKSITVPDSVRTLGEQAFEQCYALEDLRIPDTIESIPARLCFGCRHMKNLLLPSNVKTIGSESFSGCSKLRGLHIPPSVEKISNDAFVGCTALKLIYLASSKMADLDWIPKGADVIRA